MRQKSLGYVKKKFRILRYFVTGNPVLAWTADLFVTLVLGLLLRIAESHRLYSCGPGRPCKPPGCEAARLPQMLPARRQSSHPEPRRNACRKPPLNASPAPVASTTGTGRAGCRYTLPSAINNAPRAPSFTTGTRTQSCNFSKARKAVLAPVIA